jgi:hypothetical protein
MYHSQASQDKFILNVLKQKRDGTFLELGSHHPININNTYILEKEFGWKGIMVEYDEKYLDGYKQHRENSVHIISDATKIDYKKLFEDNQMPQNVDYLQIDLEANNGSTMETLEKLDAEIFDKHKFAVVTFEHDYYCAGEYKSTREKSRKLFEKRGYVSVFEDVHDREPSIVFEDWYVHPDLVDMEYINNLKDKNMHKYIKNTMTGKSIDWRSICYEDDVKITYSIQVRDESRELFTLLDFLIKVIDYVDNIHVVVDTTHKTEKVQEVLEHFSKNITVFERAFDTSHGNSMYHKEVATGDYVFTLEADEIPQETLIKSIKSVISVEGSEIIFVPRVNICPNMTQEYLHISEGFEMNRVGWLNWPDYQSRIYRRDDHITWSEDDVPKLHGSDKVTGMKDSPLLALWRCISLKN